MDEDAASVTVVTTAYWRCKDRGMTPKTVVCMKGNWLEPRRQCWSAEDGRTRKLSYPSFLELGTL